MIPVPPNQRSLSPTKCQRLSDSIVDAGVFASISAIILGVAYYNSVWFSGVMVVPGVGCLIGRHFIRLYRQASALWQESEHIQQSAERIAEMTDRVRIGINSSAELHVLKEKEEKLSAELVDLRSENRAQKQKIKEISEMIEVLTQAKQELQGKNVHLKEKEEALENDLKAFSDLMHHLKRENAELQEKIETLQKMIEQLKNKDERSILKVEKKRRVKKKIVITTSQLEPGPGAGAGAGAIFNPSQSSEEPATPLRGCFTNKF